MSRLPFELSVAKPCTQQWNDMTGSASQRHCQSCNKQVHNFAAMTAREIERVIDQTGGQFCARVTRQLDGDILFLAEPQSRHMANFVFAAALALTSPMAAQATKPTKTGAVTGLVRDPSGVPIPGVKIEVVQPGEPETIVVTDQNGVYKLEAPRGSHTLEATMPGFGPYLFPATFAHHTQTIAPITLQIGSAVTGEMVVVDNRPWYKKIGSRTKRLLHISS